MRLSDERTASALRSTPREITILSREVDDWVVVANEMPVLQKEFFFPNFALAIWFVNKIGVLAEDEGHHPEITFTWGKAVVRWWSHDRGGITRDDFIMAAKTDAIAQGQQSFGQG